MAAARSTASTSRARAASASASPGRSTSTRTAPRPRPRRVPSRDPWSRVRWDRVGRVGMLIVLGIVAVLYAEHLVSYLSTRSQADRELAAVQSLARQNRRLSAEQQSLGQPATIQHEARALGMVRAGERAYVVTGLPGR